MRNPCKVPFRERVPKQRLPKVSFAGFFHRVAWSAAPWAPIVFRAKGPIGITRSYQPDQLPIWTCRVDFAGSSQHRCLRPEVWRSRPRHAWQWLRCLSSCQCHACDNPVIQHSSRALVALRRVKKNERHTHSFQHAHAHNPTAYQLINQSI